MDGAEFFCRTTSFRPVTVLDEDLLASKNEILVLDVFFGHIARM